MNDTPNESIKKAPKQKGPEATAFISSRAEENAQCLELGAAWENADGKGFNIVLDVVPVGGFNGRLTLRKIEPKTGA